VNKNFGAPKSVSTSDRPRLPPAPAALVFSGWPALSPKWHTIQFRPGTLRLELKDIQSMYERAEATPNDLAYPYLTTSGDPQVPGISWTPKPDGFAFEEAWDEDTENKNYIVFVHGWRMGYLESRNYAESFYKRLWQRGYKGRFAFRRKKPSS